LKLFTAVYPQLKVIQTEWNSLWAQFTSYFIVSCVITLIFNAYQAVAMQNPKGIFGILFGYFILAIVILAFAKPYALSVRLLQSWKPYAKDKLFRKVLCCYRPLAASNGSYGFIDKPLLLTLSSIIAINSVSLIITRNGV
jgi:hypothetical protein